MESLSQSSSVYYKVGDVFSLGDNGECQISFIPRDSVTSCDKSHRKAAGVSASSNVHVFLLLLFLFCGHPWVFKRAGGSNTPCEDALIFYFPVNLTIHFLRAGFQASS